MKYKKYLIVALLALLCFSIAAPAFADEVAKAAVDTAGGWQNVTQQDQLIQMGESFRATHLVAAAYGFIWLMVALFVYSVWRRSARLEKEIKALRDTIAKSAHPAASQKIETAR